MPAAVALAVLVRALVALALALLASPLAKPIVNLVQTGWGAFDRSIAWLTNKAIDLGIEFTKWLGPEFEQGLKPLVNYIHHMGQYSHDTAFSIYRNAVSHSKFAHWVVHTYVPHQLRAWTDHSTSTTLVKVRTQPFTKAQLQRLEDTIARDLARRNAAAIPGIVAKPFPQINWTPKHWRAWLFPGAIGAGWWLPDVTSDGHAGAGAGTGGRVVTKPGANTWDHTQWREQAKTNKNTRSRLRQLEKLAGATAAAALVTAGLAKLGLGWMPKCRNLKGIGKSFCAANLAGLIGLLGTAIALEEGVGLEEFANAMLKVEKPIVDGILRGITEFEGIAI